MRKFHFGMSTGLCMSYVGDPIIENSWEQHLSSSQKLPPGSHSDGQACTEMCFSLLGPQALVGIDVPFGAGHPAAGHLSCAPLQL